MPGPPQAPGEPRGLKRTLSAMLDQEFPDQGLHPEATADSGIQMIGPGDVVWSNGLVPKKKGTFYVRTVTTKGCDDSPRDERDSEDTEDGFVDDDADRETVCRIYVGNHGLRNKTQIITITARQCVGSEYTPREVARKIVSTLPKIQDVFSMEIDSAIEHALSVKKALLGKM